MHWAKETILCIIVSTDLVVVKMQHFHFLYFNVCCCMNKMMQYCTVYGKHLICKYFHPFRYHALCSISFCVFFFFLILALIKKIIVIKNYTVAVNSLHTHLVVCFTTEFLHLFCISVHMKYVVGLVKIPTVDCSSI